MRSGREHNVVAWLWETARQLLPNTMGSAHDLAIPLLGTPPAPELEGLRRCCTLVLKAA